MQKQKSFYIFKRPIRLIIEGKYKMDYHLVYEWFMMVALTNKKK